MQTTNPYLNLIRIKIEICGLHYQPSNPFAFLSNPYFLLEILFFINLICVLLNIYSWISLHHQTPQLIEYITMT